MGHSTRAVGILLAAFMGGLAAGAWAAGRIVPSVVPSRALRIYAVLEASIAAYALLLPVLLASARPILQWVYADGNAAGPFHATIAVLALLLLSVPTAAMGATYPVAVRCVANDRRDRADSPDRSNRLEHRNRKHRHGVEEVEHADRPEQSARYEPLVARFAGGLYAANTFGAALGAGLTGFALLPALGIRGTTMVGVALNAIAAVGALALARRQAAPRAAAHDVAPAPSGHAADLRKAAASALGIPQRVRLRAAATALGISGLVALIYQVTWTRTLAMVLGPTTYAFSTVVVAVIAGLGIGSTLAAVRAPRSPERSMTWLGCVMIAAAAAALAASATVDRLPLVVASLVSRPGTTFESVLAMQIAMVVAIQLPMAIAFGAAFPLAIAAADSKTGTAPRDVSIVYATNTLGAIAGAIAASFLLIPTFGIQTSVRLAAILAAVTGVAVAVARPAAVGWRTRIAVMLAGAATVAVAMMAPEWNVARLANGGYRYASILAAGDLQAALEAGRLLYYREGAAGTVSVREFPGARSLAIDGKVDASNTGDMLTQKLLAHLPLLLHPNPRRVCIIGLGSGVTLGASLVHPIERADVVEISPQVVEASAFFARENHDALNDPRTRLILGDGRSHLLLSQEQYDVIISEPSNPWMAGVASLFTREFFAAARARLAPGGILLQWAHTYNISDADLRSIVGTFVSVFPEGSAWLVGDGDLLLVGAMGPLAALEHGISSSWARPGVAADLAEVAARDLFSVLSLFVGGTEELQRYGAGAHIQSDDRLLLEYSAPRALYGVFQRTNVDQLRAVARGAPQPPAVVRARSEAMPEQWRNRGLMQLRANAADLAYADLREAIMKGLADADTLHGLARSAVQLGRLDETQRLLSAIAYTDTWRRPDAANTATVPVLIELSIVHAALGHADEATAAARDAVLRDPGNGAALKQLASMYADGENEQALERLIQLVEQAAVDRSVLLYCRTRLAYVRGDFEAATQLGEQLVMLEPSDVNVHNLLGSAYSALGRYDLARKALEASLRIEPANPGVLVNLGTLALRAGDAATAVNRFSEALFLSPTNPAALNGLADALDRQGNQARAAEIRALVPARAAP